MIKLVKITEVSNSDKNCYVFANVITVNHSYTKKGSKKAMTIPVESQQNKMYLFTTEIPFELGEEIPSDFIALFSKEERENGTLLF